MRRVVITGMGAVSALGNTVAETWEGIKAGRCGIDKITVNYDTRDDKVKIAAECKTFDPTAFMDKKDAARWRAFPNLPLQRRCRRLRMQVFPRKQ